MVAAHVPQCLDQRGFHADKVLVRGQLDRSLVEVGVYGVLDLDFAGVIALALRSCFGL
jgi:hypothetical protein